jgi:hypothetical protein
MIAADERWLVSAVVDTQKISAVTTSVQKHTYVTIRPALNDDRIFGHVAYKIVAVLRNQ